MVTGEQVKAAAIAAGITRVDNRDCSICGCMTYYSISGDKLFFNPGCNCSWGDREPRSWDDAAEWINKQTNDEHRVRIAKLFGLEIE